MLALHRSLPLHGKLQRLTVATLFAKYPPLSQACALPAGCVAVDLVYEMTASALMDVAGGGPYPSLVSLSMRLFGSGRSHRGVTAGRPQPGDSAAPLLDSLGALLCQTSQLKSLCIIVFNDLAGENTDRLLRALRQKTGEYDLLEVRAYGCTTHDLMLMVCGTVTARSIRLLMRCMDFRMSQDLWAVLNMEPTEGLQLAQTMELTLDPFPDELRVPLAAHWLPTAPYGAGGRRYRHPNRNWQVGCPA